MDIFDFYNAVSAGNTEIVRKFHSEHPQFPMNRSLHIPTMMGLRLIQLPLIIAFYEGRLETARYLYRNGADLNAVCQKCQKTPREFMPEGFPKDDCRSMSFKVFKERVYEAVFSDGGAHGKTLLKRLQKSREHIREMYEYATDEELFRTSGTAPIKNAWTEEKLNEWLRVSGELACEEKLTRFKNGDYLWPYILTTARQLAGK
jgi:hypothetical protein